MADLLRVPPGRAGRLWLRERLRTSRRAADLLDRKLRILRTEQDRARRLCQATEAEWTRCWREADRWLLRAVLVSGERELMLCATGSAAEVTVSWAGMMGLRYPAGVSCRLPEPEVGQHSPGVAGLVEAAAAYRSAVQAAAAHAVAATAVRVLDRGVAQTRQRLRAVAERRVPELEEALRALTARLEEAERAELVRLRWAAAHPPRTDDD